MSTGQFDERKAGNVVRSQDPNRTTARVLGRGSCGPSRLVRACPVVRLAMKGLVGPEDTRCRRRCTGRTASKVANWCVAAEQSGASLKWAPIVEEQGSGGVGPFVNWERGTHDKDA